MSPQILRTQNVWEKLKNIEATCHSLLSGQGVEIPNEPGRDVEIRHVKELPAKKGLSFAQGQARLLHDLASIELQAMELGIRTLSEFPAAPNPFREELAQVTLEEGKHLRLCLEALEELGFPWGSFPTHLGLWQCVSSTDSLLDRILIVHRYLEGSGLDASDHLLMRLKGISAPRVSSVLEVIAHDEIAHVQFGSNWYRRICAGEGIDPENDFRPRILNLIRRIPKRMERINAELRARAGFSAGEISALNEVQAILAQPKERIPQAVKNASDPL